MKFDLTHLFLIDILYQENIIFPIIAHVQQRILLRETHNRYLNGPSFLYQSLESVLNSDDIKEEEKDQVKYNQNITDQTTKVTSVFP